MEYLHQSIYKKRASQNVWLALCNDDRTEIKRSGKLLSTSPLCGETSVSAPGFKSIKSLKMEDSASPTSHRPMIERRIPLLLGAQVCHPHQDTRLGPLCRHPWDRAQSLL